MKEDNYKGEINKALRDARIQKDLTCEQVAVQNDMCMATYFAYEQYSKTPSLYIAYKLANFFGTTVEEIFPPEIIKPDGRNAKRGARRR